MRTDDKVTEDVENAERGDIDRAVRGGIDSENECIESVVLKWNQEVFSRVPFAAFVKSVLHGEPGWIPVAGHAEHECDDIGRWESFMAHTSSFYSWGWCTAGHTRGLGWTDWNLWVSGRDMDIGY